MKKITLFTLLGAVFLSTACIEVENKNHPPFEPTTIQTAEQKSELKKLANEAKANYNEKKKSSTH